jgi:hypothetical protein
VGGGFYRLRLGPRKLGQRWDWDSGPCSPESMLTWPWHSSRTLLGYICSFLQRYRNSATTRLASCYARGIL